MLRETGRPTALVDAEKADGLLVFRQNIGCVSAQRHVDLLRTPFADVQAAFSERLRREGRTSLADDCFRQC